MNTEAISAPGSGQVASGEVGKATLTRLFGWMMLGLLAAFLVNVYLIGWQDWPGAGLALTLSDEADARSFVQLAIVAAGLALGALWVFTHPDATLREDSARVSNINTFFIRAMFWAIVFVGVTDSVISFLRVEGLLPAVVGEELSSQLGRSAFRGAYVHMPLIALGFALASITRTLGFYWLALIVVIAELLIVFARFVFSYEQAFMADLVRFWYAALFLFASAYTLLEEGHVRVDVFYAGLNSRAKGWINASGTLLFGLPLCWTILYFGAGTKQSIIIAPMVIYEISQAGFGLYVKYLMAGLLGVFAVSMNIQFISYFLDAVADIRQDPGGRDHDVHNIQ